MCEQMPAAKIEYILAPCTTPLSRVVVVAVADIEGGTMRDVRRPQSVPPVPMDRP